MRIFAPQNFIDMSTFWTFAIILTVGYILYYAAMITIDITAKPKSSASDEEVIETGMAGDTATDVIEDSSGGFSVNPAGGMVEGFSDSDSLAPTQGFDFASSVIRDRGRLEEDIDGESDEVQSIPEADHSAYMPPVSPQAGQQPEEEPAASEEEVRFPPAEPTDRSEYIPTDGGSSDEASRGTDDPASMVDAYEQQEVREGGTDEEPFDTSRFAYQPQDEASKPSEDDSFDASEAFTQHLTPQFVVNEIHFPETSSEVERETEANNDALEPIMAKGGGVSPEELALLMKPGSLERRGIEYEVY